jgi:hypothetical protein
VSPELKVERFEVRIEGGQVFVKVG